MTLFTGCNNDIDEFQFTGRVVGAEFCSSSEIGYIIELLAPENIGDTITISSGRFDNAVMAYKSTRRLYESDTIKGVAYLTKSYAALNCFGLIDNGLPEMIILGVDK